MVQLEGFARRFLQQKYLGLAWIGDGSRGKKPTDRSIHALDRGRLAWNKKRIGQAALWITGLVLVSNNSMDRLSRDVDHSRRACPASPQTTSKHIEKQLPHCRKQRKRHQQRNVKHNKNREAT